MGHHHHIEVTSTKPYDFTRKNRMIAGVMMIIGLLAIITQFATHHEQTWSNLLMNNFMFMGMALCATFFLAIQYVAEVGWSAVIKRPLEAMGQALPVAGGLMIVIIALVITFTIGWMRNCLIQSLLNTMKSSQGKVVS